MFQKMVKFCDHLIFYHQISAYWGQSTRTNYSAYNRPLHADILWGPLLEQVRRDESNQYFNAVRLQV
jgi:hypothetical protein